MRVLVTGAYGLIGSACLARLKSDGHDIVATGRSVSEARRRFPYATWLAADFARLTTAESWTPLLEGIDAVVNCVGVLQDTTRDNVEIVQVTATIALFDACTRRKMRVVHISALGAAKAAPTAFARTKATADSHLAACDSDWTILRPGLVLARAAYGGTAMVRALAAMPFVTPIAKTLNGIQVVDIDDVTATVALAVSSDVLRQKILDVAHPQLHSLSDIVAKIRRWLGFPPQPVVAMPRWMQAIVSAGADALGYLGWRSPARSTALAQLGAGVVGDPEPWIRLTDIQPKSLERIFTAYPATVQDRWFARLYLLKPLMFAALALFWVATGVIALGPGRASANAQLAATGFPPSAVELTIILGAIFDIAMGLLLLFQRLARRVLLVMMAGTICYLAAGAYLAPQLWFDPLGPLTKIIPMLAATLCLLAIADER